MLGLPDEGGPDSRRNGCDDEADNESSAETQDPGAAAPTCPPVLADCVEVYLGTDIVDNCTGCPVPAATPTA